MENSIARAVRLWSIATVMLVAISGLNPVHAKKHNALSAEAQTSANNWLSVASKPANQPYLQSLRLAEAKHGIPHNMLVRLAYQESRFRPEVVSGKVVSVAGATGIMQIVPRHHPGVDPLDPHEAIDYAGRFLRQLFNEFGRWDLALAAYNWGAGNVRKFGLRKAPKETREYYASIIDDSAPQESHYQKTLVAADGNQQRAGARGKHVLSARNKASAAAEGGMIATAQGLFERTRSWFKSVGGALQRAAGMSESDAVAAPQKGRKAVRSRSLATR